MKKEYSIKGPIEEVYQSQEPKGSVPNPNMQRVTTPNLRERLMSDPVLAKAFAEEKAKMDEILERRPSVDNIAFTI